TTEAAHVLRVRCLHHRGHPLLVPLRVEGQRPHGVGLRTRRFVPHGRRDSRDPASLMSDRERRTRVLLLFGGRSAEHDVSRVTAVSVAAALDPDRYEVVPVAITTDGAWLLAEDARELLERTRKQLPEAFAVAGTPVAPPALPGQSALMPLDGSAPFA